MKTLKLTKMSALTNLLTVAAIVLGVSPASAGNGGGYAGPTTSTISIPGAADRGITLAKMNEAYDLCLGGDSARPDLVSVIDKMARAFNLRPPHQRDGFVGIWRSTTYKETLGEGQKDFPFTANAAHYAAEANENGFESVRIFDTNLASGRKLGFLQDVDSLNVYEEDRSMRRPDRIGIDVAIKDAGNVGDHLFLISEKPVVLPKFVFKSVKRDSQYDQFGRLRTEGTVVQGVSIEVAGDIEEPVQFVNLKTGMKVDIELDVEDLVSCLRNEVQNRLGK